MPSFNFFMRIAAVNAQEPMSGQTLLLDSAGDESVAEAVKQSYRDLYAVEFKNEKPKPQESKADNTKIPTNTTQETIVLTGSVKHGAAGTKKFPHY